MRGMGRGMRGKEGKTDSLLCVLLLPLSIAAPQLDSWERKEGGELSG